MEMKGLTVLDETQYPDLKDPRVKRILWHLVGSSRGSKNRAKIIKMLYSTPSNSNQIATKLGLDYKTITHHIEILKNNGLIICISENNSYGATYFLTPLMEKNYQLCKEIIDKR
jgi:predicted transcriptional regulator